MTLTPNLARNLSQYLPLLLSKKIPYSSAYCQLSHARNVEIVNGKTRPFALKQNS